jgi:hypothetical protein
MDLNEVLSDVIGTLDASGEGKLAYDLNQKIQNFKSYLHEKRSQFLSDDNAVRRHVIEEVMKEFNK